ncbi:hypothetical protein [Streptomyces sp. bgisy034]|uniref:hypothetical protein n=1 Tax=Streptomyces sp. bgisy034 TaxID=3413774 RepID=UPI003EBE5E10
MALCVLENDPPPPALNGLGWPYRTTDPGLRRAVARGVPFGTGRTGPLRVDRAPREREPEVPVGYVRHGLVGALRAVTSMGQARAAASMVLPADGWWAVGEADLDRPLPGYARWALSVRPDGPPLVRQGCGSHAKFTHRLRQAGTTVGARHLPVGCRDPELSARYGRDPGLSARYA